MGQLPAEVRNPDEEIVDSARVIEMVEQCFESMLALPVEPMEDRSGSVEDGSLQAVVRIIGDHRSEIHVIAPQSLAHTVARAMFGAAEGELSGAEVEDALGEIANVIGGNVKGLADGDCELSLPCVGEFAATLPTRGRCESFRCQGDVFHVLLAHH